MLIGWYIICVFQICFMNDTAAVGDGVTDSNVADTASTGTDSNAAITDVNVAITDTSPATITDSTQVIYWKWNVKY